MKIPSLLFIILLSVSGYAQVIKRAANGKARIPAKRLDYTLGTNIFAEFGWTKPDVKSKAITLSSKSFVFDGVEYSLSESSEGELMLSDGKGYSFTSKLSKSKKDIYYDKSILLIKDTVKYRWVSHQEYRMENRLVTKTRPATRYQYDFVSKTTRTVYYQESYSVMEQHYVPYTSWRWESYHEYALNIPVYNYYSLKLKDYTQLFVYEIQEQGEIKYFLQNPSYISAQDEAKINYIVVDNTCSGDYSGKENIILFNTWNPYSQSSSYKSMPYFRENSWYKSAYLYEEYFYEVSVTADSLILHNKNDEFKNEKRKGKLSITNMPEKAEIQINGREYSLKNDRPYNCEYGLFTIRIVRKGYLDFEKSFVVNESSSENTIRFEETNPAIVFKIKDNVLSEYFLEVSNKSGYSRIYHNTDEVNLPEGENTIEIYSQGYSFKKVIVAEPGKEQIFDFQEEIEKKKE
jgi:hypothetical protein